MVRSFLQRPRPRDLKQLTATKYCGLGTRQTQTKDCFLRKGVRGVAEVNSCNQKFALVCPVSIDFQMLTVPGIFPGPTK